jgi:DNA repair exonuclease SbcCD ATPase subunit
VAGLTTRNVSSSEQALNVLHEGTRNRTTAATLMNLTSSRSHAVFTINLQQTNRSAENVDVTTTSRFTFVDLAGSERMKKTGAEGERAREGIKINEGLLALGNVINALADEERHAKEKKIHVPYRQSKLTRLLQDALGGNSQTLFLACVSPADTNASETLSTLHYANRARNIKNAPTKNVDVTVVELQRLHALARVLQCELVKQKFGKENAVGDSNELGEVDEQLLDRTDVKEYLESIHRTAEERRGSPTTLLKLPASANPPPVTVFPSSSSTTPLLKGDRPRILSDDAVDKSRFDDTFLEEVNPEQEMAILDQLLELQHQDSEYDKEHKKDQEQLKLVQGELEEQETMLLQLRESLKVYHNLKEKYELLMAEVQQLETEKATLADQLEKATADPTKGCSLAIKKKLEKVEKSLVRARSETKKHQQMYRKAEQQAQKCRALEVKIGQLKQGKVALMKKQKEAAARHREYTETKTREILALKRKERTTDKRLSKLQTEIQIHKNNLEKRKVFCDKLTGKLKQTEAHLMKLLAMRKRELHHRTSIPIPSRRRATQLSAVHEDNSRSGASNDKGFATKSQDLASSRFLLERMISEQVLEAQMKLKYEDKVAEYGELMRSLVSEVENLNEAKSQAKGDDDLSDLEQNVEDLELKLELVGSELDDLRIKLPQGDDAFVEGQANGVLILSEPSKKILSGLSSPVLRTLLLEMTEKRAMTEVSWILGRLHCDSTEAHFFFSCQQLECQRQAISIERKESALQSFENEMDALNRTVQTLTNELSQRRALAKDGSDPFGQIQELKERESSLRRDIEAARQQHTTMKEELHNAQQQLQDVETAKAEISEKLTVADAIVRQHTDMHEAEETLARLQEIWKELGVEASDRAEVEREVRSCLEDTCSRKLQEASELKAKTIGDLHLLREQITSMSSVLGKESGCIPEVEGTLLKRLKSLQEQADRIRPEFESAVSRRAKLVADVDSLMKSLESVDYSLSRNLSKMVDEHKLYGDRCFEACTEEPQAVAKSQRAEMMKAVSDMVKSLDGILPSGGEPIDLEANEATNYGPVDSLKSTVLEECESEVAKLRLVKSEKLARNAKCREETNALVTQMHLSTNEVISIVERAASHHNQPLPEWWSKQKLEDVSRAVTTSDSILTPSESFTKHLDSVQDAVAALANDRRALSEALKGVIDRAQKTLLMTVDGELDVSEAYASFHNALFQLPPLSEEHIQACITELSALINGVEAMTQSEVEALTVVWEALNISSGDRGNFWESLEADMAELQARSESPFDQVMSQGPEEAEEWVRAAVAEAKKVYRSLDVRLYKLEQVHKEVERLRSKQDMKSRVLSLDSEIRILSAKLADFEEKKCDKSRLLTKKTGSSALLKEERFRKQMQGKFTAKLEQLSHLLQSWIETEGSSFDGTLLSEEVRMLLQSSPDKMDSWVEKRTEFMHLRTVQTKPGGKRPAGHRSTPRKRSGDSLKSSSSTEQTDDDSIARPPKKKVARSTRVVSASTASQRRPARAAKNSTNSQETRLKRKASASASDSPGKQQAKPSPSQGAPGANKSLSPDSKKPAKRSKRDSKAILPFGHLLQEAKSPSKENADN